MAHHPGRNDACPCGSGKKYKKCCELKQQNHRGNNLLLIVVGLLMAAGVVAGITAFTTERGHVGRHARRVVAGARSLPLTLETVESVGSRQFAVRSHAMASRQSPAIACC